VRLDKYCAEYWPEHSRATWQKYIAAGYVKVNGEVFTAAKKPLDEDDAVTVEIPENPNFDDDVLPVLYEDSDVIVMNKPAGVLTHAKGKIIDEFSVAEFMRRRSNFPGSERPGIVHRLDRDTSGVIIAAKTPEALSFLANQFAERKAKKTYIAVLNGIPKLDEAEINLPIGRNPKAPSTFRVSTEGKAAQTTYKVLTRTDKQALAMLKPYTGRTHQLRVHMAYLNTPILGDRVYGKEADRLYLHAQALEITLPNRERRTFTAPLPKSFTDKFPTLEAKQTAELEK
jgi:23S rRNA pseudouridine1911/1915/1917 synthase